MARLRPRPTVVNYNETGMVKAYQERARAATTTTTSGRVRKTKKKKKTEAATKAATKKAATKKKATTEKRKTPPPAMDDTPPPGTEPAAKPRPKPVARKTALSPSPKVMPKRKAKTNSEKPADTQAKVTKPRATHKPRTTKSNTKKKPAAPKKTPGIGGPGESTSAEGERIAQRRESRNFVRDFYGEQPNFLEGSITPLSSLPRSSQAPSTPKSPLAGKGSKTKKR
jgi:hypothetical protein